MNSSIEMTGGYLPRRFVAPSEDGSRQDSTAGLTDDVQETSKPVASTESLPENLPYLQFWQLQPGSSSSTALNLLAEVATEEKEALESACSSSSQTSKQAALRSLFSGLNIKTFSADEFRGSSFYPHESDDGTDPKVREMRQQGRAIIDAELKLISTDSTSPLVTRLNTDNEYYAKRLRLMLLGCLMQGSSKCFDDILRTSLGEARGYQRVLLNHVPLPIGLSRAVLGDFGLFCSFPCLWKEQSAGKVLGRFLGDMHNQAFSLNGRKYFSEVAGDSVFRASQPSTVYSEWLLYCNERSLENFQVLKSTLESQIGCDVSDLFSLLKDVGRSPLTDYLAGELKVVQINNDPIDRKTTADRHAPSLIRIVNGIRLKHLMQYRNRESNDTGNRYRKVLEELLNRNHLNARIAVSPLLVVADNYVKQKENRRHSSTEGEADAILQEVVEALTIAGNYTADPYFFGLTIKDHVEVVFRCLRSQGYDRVYRQIFAEIGRFSAVGEGFEKAFERFICQAHDIVCQCLYPEVSIGSYATPDLEASDSAPQSSSAKRSERPASSTGQVEPKRLHTGHKKFGVTMSSTAAVSGKPLRYIFGKGWIQ